MHNPVLTTILRGSNCYSYFVDEKMETQVKSFTQIAYSLTGKKIGSKLLISLCFHLNSGEWEYTCKIFFLSKMFKSEEIRGKVGQMMAMCHEQGSLIISFTL